MVTKFDHPDFVGGIVWSDCELRWINEKLAAAQAERDELLAGLKALYEAMIRYEGDVGGDAPQEHHEMMRSVAKIIAKGEKHA